MVQRVNLHPKPRPRFIEPMECTRVATLPEGEDWVYEIKQDGYRAIGLVDGSSAMLYSMSGQDYTSEFRHIVFALRNLHQGNLVLDGEIVALDEQGRASFQELQNRRATKRPIVYYLFDLLHQNGHDTLELSLGEKKSSSERGRCTFFRCFAPKSVLQHRTGSLGSRGEDSRPRRCRCKTLQLHVRSWPGITRMAEAPFQSGR
jgi:hypothetical protein